MMDTTSLIDTGSLTEVSRLARFDREPTVAFLGVCERAAYVQEGNTELFKWNVIGLKNFVLSHIYPLPLSGCFIGFALSLDIRSHQHKFRLTDEAEHEVGTIDLSTIEASSNDSTPLLKKDGPVLCTPQHGWVTAFVCLNDCQMIIPAPGVYHLRHVTESEERIVGEIHFASINPAPLSQERIAAIRTLCESSPRRAWLQGMSGQVSHVRWARTKPAV